MAQDTISSWEFSQTEGIRDILLYFSNFLHFKLKMGFENPAFDENMLINCFSGNILFIKIVESEYFLQICVPQMIISSGRSD